VKSYIMRISRLKDKLQRVGETMSDMELVIVTLRGLPPIGETFDEIVRNLTHEESRMISRGMIQKHEEGEPIVFVTQKQEEERKCRSIKFNEASSSKSKENE